MCGRYAFSASAVQQLARAFRAEQVAALTPRLNHAPTQPGPVALMRQGQPVCIEMLRWGLVVPWTPAPLINAQSETAAQKPTFRSALEKQRCLIPADAFYEWQDDTKPKQPWEFRLANDEPLVFAGIWNTGTLPNGERVDAYCILTTQANDTLRRCHDRMPVILRRDDWEAWLSPDSSSPRLQVFCKPWPGPMLARPVTTKINKAAYDGPVEEVSLDRKAPAPAQDNELPLF
jgi:putative SOS response-associated peptidase YedK